MEEAMDLDHDESVVELPLPLEYSIGVTDVLLFYGQQDDEAAHDFIENIQNMIEELNLDATIRAYDELNEENPNLQELDGVEKMCRFTGDVWYYVTDNTNDDESMNLHKNEQIMRSLKKKNFCPVFVKKKDDYENLGYGLKSYVGLYVDDPRLQRKVRSMLTRAEHTAEMQRLREFHAEETEKWRRKERERLAKEREERLARVDRLHAEQVKRQRSNSYSSAESDVPSYLLESLNRARSSLANISSNVYNITINQPKQVIIGNKGDVGDNIRIVRSESDENSGSEHGSIAVKETRYSPSNHSSSSFENIDPSYVAREQGGASAMQ